MSSNNHALIRYKTIDRCLKSRDHEYFLPDLINECSQAVHDYEEKRTGKKKAYKEISRRTLQYDLKFMKDPEFGFGAPIEHTKTEGYFYSDIYFEAFKAQMSSSDLERLGDSLLVLKQLSGDAQFKDLESLVTRLEETYRIKRNRKSKSIIYFENSTNIKGQKWITEIKKLIQKKEVAWINYHPFHMDSPYKRVISPYSIKESNNRWFLFGYDHDKNLITNLGLDRIKEIGPSLMPFHSEPDFDVLNFTKDIVGVSVPSNLKKQKVKIKVYDRQRFYVETKPIHSSQLKIKDMKGAAVFQLELMPNFELEAKILANCDKIEVLSPKWFKDEIALRVKEAAEKNNWK